MAWRAFDEAKPGSPGQLLQIYSERPQVRLTWFRVLHSAVVPLARTCEGDRISARTELVVR